MLDDGQWVMGNMCRATQNFPPNRQTKYPLSWWLLVGEKDGWEDTWLESFSHLTLA